MSKYNIILFDLDGTLTDPVIGITNSVMYALKKYGIEVTDRTQLHKFIGPPLIDSFERFYGFSHSDAVKSVEYYREYYGEKGIFENSVYDGVEELLINLNKNGKKVILATSKPEFYAVKILEYFNLKKYFFFIGGSTMGEKRTDKAEVIEYVLSQCEIKDKAAVVMIGDREHDIIGAAKNGIDSIGVLFGYGSRTELEKAGANYIAETVNEIEKYLYL